MARVTLKEIAHEAGVSIATVSLVLNDRPCRVANATRERIRAIAREKRYVPNQIARSLVTQRSRTLGLVVPNIESRYFSAIACQLERRCRAQGYALFITVSDDQVENDIVLLRQLANRGVDGLFLIASSERDGADLLAEELGQLSVPLVMVDRYLNQFACDRVRFDSELGGYLAARCLLDHGHRRILCVANVHGSNSGRDRVRGFRRALAEEGVEPIATKVVQSSYHIGSAYEAAGHLLESNATAVFATSDSIALGTLKRLYQAGCRVPADYSLVSYDNSSADALFEPALTAIEQDAAELSEHALSLMLRRLESPEAPSVDEVLPPRLVEKDSVRTLG